MAKSLLSKLVPTDTDGVRARKECEQWLDDAGRAQLKDARFKFLLTLKNALMSSTARKKRSATGRIYISLVLEKHGLLHVHKQLPQISLCSRLNKLVEKPSPFESVYCC